MQNPWRSSEDSTSLCIYLSGLVITSSVRDKHFLFVPQDSLHLDYGVPKSKLINMPLSEIESQILLLVGCAIGLKHCYDGRGQGGVGVTLSGKQKKPPGPEPWESFTGLLDAGKCVAGES